MTISVRDFVHPEDQAALENLRAIPLFTPCVQGFMKLFPERLLHGLNMAQKVRLGPQQLPHLYEHLANACAVLDIEEPEFYLEMNPHPNAYTYGDQQAFVTITSGLVEALDEHELLAAVAHECGHIACQHVLYHTMAQLLLLFGPAVFGPLSALSLPVRLALLYWYRRSELSADRAAAVVMGGSRPVVDAMIRFAGGPKSITSEIDLELYMQQADAYDKLTESQWDQFLQGLASSAATHPLLAVRTREITHWCRSESFGQILARTGRDAAETDMAGVARSADVAGAADAPPAGRCPACGRTLEARWRFCGHCGAVVAPAART